MKPDISKSLLGVYIAVCVLFCLAAIMFIHAVFEQANENRHRDLPLYNLYIVTVSPETVYDRCNFPDQTFTFAYPPLTF